MSVALHTPIVLVGLMGSGKSTVGVRVADRLGRIWADSDMLIEAQTGKTVAEIFSTMGEAHFRLLEAELVATLTRSDDPCVLSLGGGAVGALPTREALTETFTVWLSITPAEALARMSPEGIQRRPLLGDDPLGALTRLRAERDHFYKAVADAVISVNGRDSDVIVDELVDLVRVETG